MGLLDKAVGRAQVLAGQAKDKIEDVQARRRADELLTELGRLTYLSHTGRTPATASAEVPRLVDELRALEIDGVGFIAASVPAGDPAEGVPPNTGSPLPPPTGPAPSASPEPEQ